MEFLERILQKGKNSGSLSVAAASRVLTPEEERKLSELCEALAQVFNSVRDASLRLSGFTGKRNHYILGDRAIRSLPDPYFRLQARRSSGELMRRDTVAGLFEHAGRLPKCLPKMDWLATESLKGLSSMDDADAAKERLIGSASELIYSRMVLGGTPPVTARASMASAMRLQATHPVFTDLMEGARSHARHMFGEKTLIERSAEILSEFVGRRI